MKRPVLGGSSKSPSTSSANTQEGEKSPEVKEVPLPGLQASQAPPARKHLYNPLEVGARAANTIEAAGHLERQSEERLERVAQTLGRWKEIQKKLLDLLQNVVGTVGAVPQLPAHEQTKRALFESARTVSQSADVVQLTATRLRRYREICRRLHEAKKQVEAATVIPRGSSLPQDPQAVLKTSSQAVQDQADKVKMTKATLVAARLQKQIVQQARQGVLGEGFAAYLSRAPQAEQAVLRQVVAEAQDAGAKRRGRKTAGDSDPRKEQKRKRAEKARERRAAKKSQPATEEDKERASQRRKKHRDQRRAQRLQEQVTREDIAPRERQHDQRMARLAPEQRAIYHQRLKTSRRRGRQAIDQDLSAVHALGEDPPYQAPHEAINLNAASRLIAVRGDGWSDALSGLAKGNLVLEEWLSDPARNRNAAKGVRSRLNYAAGHFLIALPEHLQSLVQTAGKDAALSHMVDRLVARMGLQGHRVAAYLHLDSKSGHPHIHVTFARVRTDDLSVWSLEGRMRTPALWLHGRVETPLGFGEESIADDIDALGGSGEAALAGEVLMANGKLFATRTDITGKQEKIPLQGREAAKRLHAVGRSPFPLPGGIAKFGCGKDPQEERAWSEALSKAKAQGNKELVKQLLKRPPQNRGWWLPLNGKAGGKENWRFGKYLKRGLELNHRSYQGKNK